MLSIPENPRMTAKRFSTCSATPDGNWDYDFKPVFFLGILNYKLAEPSKDNEEYLHSYSIRNDKDGTQLKDSLQFVFLELARFNKRLKDCNNFIDKFLYYFKNLPTFVVKPDTQQDSYFEELLAAAEYSNMTKAEREAYNRRLKIQRDNYAADEFARKKALKEIAEGREKGLAEGLAKGMEQGMEQGIEQGMALGRSEANRDNARKMLLEGIPTEVIGRVTGLSAEEIDSL